MAARKGAKVVIGAGFGDEGKGATVDRLVRGRDSVVVRFNGGAQAGHTVVTSDGRRHVFHHVGSGAFKGAATFLSRHFASSPMHLLPEIDELATLGVVPRISADRRGLVTTPYDMMLNQIVEIVRSGGRHGSTGYGFGETVERAERGPVTTLADLEDAACLAAKLTTIRDVWVPERLAALGVADVPDDYRDLLLGDGMIDAFLVAAEKFQAAVDLVDGPSCLVRASDVVFEGAQGLALDQARGTFPFVTRSFTGLRNAIDVAREAGFDRLEAVYATRCYTTRHGAGPLAGECDAPPVPGFADATNVPNPWQGKLRFAPLDVDDLARRIAEDLFDARGSGIEVIASLAVSCLDQAGETLKLVANRTTVAVPTTAAAAFILNRVAMRHGTEAWGSSTNDVRAIAASEPLAACFVPASQSGEVIFDWRGALGTKANSVNGEHRSSNS